MDNWNGERADGDESMLYGLHQYTGDSFDITDPSSSLYDPSIVGGSEFPTTADLGNDPAGASFGSVTGTAPGAQPGGVDFNSITGFLKGLIPVAQQAQQAFAPGSAAATPGSSYPASGSSTAPAAGSSADPTGITSWISANPMLAVGGALVLALLLAKK